MASVDVVIPCYNYARFLPRSVQSVLGQEGVDVRVLVVDDCSKDESEDVGRSLARADRRVTYHRNAVNLGLVKTANIGVMDWATADYTLLLSADDAVTSGALSRASRVMDAHPNVGMAYGMALVVANDDQIVDVAVSDPFDYVVMPGTAFIDRSCGHWCGVASPTALVRTSVQHAVGGLDVRFPHTCDMEIWMRIATRSSIAALKCVQAYYRRHDTNMSAEFMHAPVSDLRLQYETVKAVLTERAVGYPDSDLVLQRMRGRLSAQALWMAGLAVEREDDLARQECLRFAREMAPVSIQQHAWWSYKAKEVLGARAVFALKSIFKSGKDRTARPYDPFKVGELFGWWPEGRAELKLPA